MRRGLVPENPIGDAYESNLTMTFMRFFNGSIGQLARATSPAREKTREPGYVGAREFLVSHRPKPHAFLFRRLIPRERSPW